MLQRVRLADTVIVERSAEGRGVSVSGFEGDTIVRAALTAVASAAGEEASFSASIEKRIPVAAGLGGGSSDAATALRSPTAPSTEPLSEEALLQIAAVARSRRPVLPASRAAARYRRRLGAHAARGSPGTSRRPVAAGRSREGVDGAVSTPRSTNGAARTASRSGRNACSPHSPASTPPPTSPSFRATTSRPHRSCRRARAARSVPSGRDGRGADALRALHRRRPGTGGP